MFAKKIEDLVWVLREVFQGRDVSVDNFYKLRRRVEELFPGARVVDTDDGWRIVVGDGRGNEAVIVVDAYGGVYRGFWVENGEGR